jgi:hypothetical protein
MQTGNYLSAVDSSIVEFLKEFTSLEDFNFYGT